MAETSTITPYAPRAAQNLPLWRTEDWLIKPYSVSIEADESGVAVLETDTVEQAKQIVELQLKASETVGHSYGLAFCILHRSLAGTWCVTGWWAHDNILCTQLANKPSGARFEVVDSAIRACVHELAIVEHERRAWIDVMMNGNRDPETWASNVFPESVC